MPRPHTPAAPLILELTRPQWAAVFFTPVAPPSVRAKLDTAVAPYAVRLTAAEVDAFRADLGRGIWVSIRTRRQQYYRRVDAKLAALQARVAAARLAGAGPAAGARAGDPSTLTRAGAARWPEATRTGGGARVHRPSGLSVR